MTFYTQSGTWYTAREVEHGLDEYLWIFFIIFYARCRRERKAPGKRVATATTIVGLSSQYTICVMLAFTLRAVFFCFFLLLKMDFYSKMGKSGTEPVLLLLFIQLLHTWNGHKIG